MSKPSSFIQRFIDGFFEQKQMLPPITGYEKVALVSLEEAVDPLINDVPEVKRMVWTVKENLSTPSDGLTIDESASIRLYSLEWQPREKSFYFALNAALRAKERNVLKPWFLYMKLFIVALSKLPSQSCTVFRGVKEDLRKDYPEKSTPIWWGFSSCTTMMSVLQAEEYLGKTGVRTMFQIDCNSGKDIRRHSFFESENEMLLLAARQFQVISCLDVGNHLYIIHMKEIDPAYPLLNTIDSETEMFLNLTTTKWNSTAVTVAGGCGLGSAANQLHYPYSFIVDVDNETSPTIYIADSYNHRIVTANGGMLIGGKGCGNRLDQLNCPSDILLDKKNNCLIISDRGNRRVLSWSLSKLSRGKILLENIDCWGLAMDKEGALYVVDVEQHSVKRFLSANTDGTIVAGGNGKGDQLNQLHSPHYIFVDRNQTIYVSDYKNNRIMKWEKNAREGKIIENRRAILSTRLSRLNGPEGIFVDSIGTIFVVDSQNHRVLRWNQSESEFNVIVGGKGSGNNHQQLCEPNAIGFDKKENLYVLDWRNHRLQQFCIQSK